MAGIYGVIILLPQYFMEAKNGRDFPPAITHPEYYYGFIGVALAWQIVFFIISRNPEKYRLLMVPAILEKASFAIATVILHFTNRLAIEMLGAGLIDLILGILFVVSYFMMRKDS